MDGIAEINLACGANTQQNGSLIKLNSSVDYEILSRNKDLEYIDYLNLSEVILLLGEFFDVNAVVIANESNICSVALGATDEDAYLNAVDCDPIGILSATAGFSKSVSLSVAKQLKSMNIKNVMAPEFTKDAFSFLLDTDINIVKINTPLHELLGFSEKDIKVTPFGTLQQEQNNSKLTKNTFTVVSQAKPTQEQVEDSIFAWKIAKHLKNKSAVIVKDLSTKAVVQGFTNTVLAVESAMDYACENSKDAVLALDGAIENEQVINACIQGRIGLIIEAGDSSNSQNILKLADKYELSVIFTKIRNNKY